MVPNLGCKEGVVKKFLSNSCPVFLHGVSQLSLDPPGTKFSVVLCYNDMVHFFLTNTEL